MSSLLIAADICPIGNNRPLFMAGDARGLLNDLLPEFERADLMVANLECPLIGEPSPIMKTGPIFGAPGDCIKAIKNAGIGVLCLANNHILDHGGAGLINTLKVCAQEGVETVGAGKNLAAAGRIVVRDCGGVRVGLLAAAEHEFSIAGENSPGANPLDLITFVRNIREHRASFDFLVVLLHGAAEFFAPTPRIQNTCRFMIEMGADVVIVQHPHILGGYENYLGGHIVYGQGALLMDEDIYRNRKSFHEGFLVKLTLNVQLTTAGFQKSQNSPSSQLTLIPFTQSDPGPGARRMVPEREQAFYECLAERSRMILDKRFVEAEWVKFCEENKHGYIGSLLGFNRVMHKLNRNGLLFRLLYGKRPLLGVRNLIQCETHREAIETIFQHQLCERS